MWWHCFIPLIGCSVALALGVFGCASSARQVAPVPLMLGGLRESTYDEDLEARVVPPEGWEPGTPPGGSRHPHRVWVSPTGDTAYGVIHFSLPFPVGHDLILWGFLREMKASEGEARLVSKTWDANQRLLRFVAEGGKYTVRTNLLVKGFDGWAVYAGTLAGQPVRADELELAERAREHTLVGTPPAPSAGAAPHPASVADDRSGK